MNPLLYIPGELPRTDETLRALGLGQLLEPGIIGAMWSDVLGETPDGRRGCLVQFDDPLNPERSSPRGLDLARQTWRKAAKQNDLASGRYWIGWDKAHPPGPEDLRRSETVSGELMPLLDNQSWEIAISTFVPMRRGIDIESGEEVRLPQGPYAPFVDRCRQIESDLFDNLLGLTAESIVSRTVKIEGGLQFVCDALAVNYRVVPDLLAGLGLIGDEHVSRAILIAIGITTMVEISREKKTA